MLFKRILTLFLIINSSLIIGQTIQRESHFSSAGNYSNNAGIILQSNIGEMMITTENNGQNMFIQGFVQPEPVILTSIPSLSGMGGSVYPNPVINNLVVQIYFADCSDLKIEVFDVLGKKQLFKREENQFNGYVNYELNFQSFSAGIYFVRVVSERNQFNKTFKINKI